MSSGIREAAFILNARFSLRREAAFLRESSGQDTNEKFFWNIAPSQAAKERECNTALYRDNGVEPVFAHTAKELGRQGR